MQRSRVLIGLYLAAVFLYWVAQYLYMPTPPLYVALHTENLAMVGVVLSMYGLWQAIIRIPLGIFADWLGWRKPLIIVGVVLAGLGAWMMGTAHGIPQLLIGRTLTGLAAGTWSFICRRVQQFFSAAGNHSYNSAGNSDEFGRTHDCNCQHRISECRGGLCARLFAATGAALVSALMMLSSPNNAVNPNSPHSVTIYYSGASAGAAAFIAQHDYSIWRLVLGLRFLLFSPGH